MSEKTQIAMPAGFNLVPTNATEAWRLAEMLAQSDMVPKDYKGKPGNVMVAAAMGAELGLPPVQSLQNIAVINGRPSVWGDALIGLVRGRADCEDIQETFDRATMTAKCVVKRRGQSPVEAEFSQEDAKRASLWGKQGPWTQYPERMLKMRARAFAIRDAFPDVLRGVAVAEEVRDISPEPRDVTPPPQTQGGSAALKQRLASQQPQTIEPDEAEAELVANEAFDKTLEQIEKLDTREQWRDMRIAIQNDAWTDPERHALTQAMNEAKERIKNQATQAPPEADPKEPADAAFKRYRDQLGVVKKADAIQEVIDAFQRDPALTAGERDLLAQMAQDAMDDSIPY